MIKSKWIFIGWTLVWLAFSCYSIYLYNFQYSNETGVGIGFFSIYLGMPAGYFGVMLAGVISIKFKLEGVWQVVATVFFSYLFSLLFWLLIGKVINKIIYKPAKNLQGKEWFQ